MLTQGMDMAQASNASGISQDPKLGEGEGLIGASHPYLGYTYTTLRANSPELLHPLVPGVLSRGRVRRLEYTVGAVTNALFFAENEGWYD